MLVKTIKPLVNVGWMLLVLSACNGGGSHTIAPSNPGNLVLTNATSNIDVVLGGTHQYFVSLVNSTGLPAPVTVTVMSSNANVAMIESNTCATTQLQSNGSVQTCTFFVAGDNIGNANINVISANYPTITESLNVTQQWGTFSGGNITDDLPRDASQLSFGGNYVYAMSRSGIVVKSDGTSWQEIGGGNFITDGFNSSPTMISDESHVCISLNNNPDQSGEIKCSFNGSNWQTLPVINGAEIADIKLYQGNLYVLISAIAPIQFAVMYCPVDNCTGWQQQGQELLSNRYQGILYNSIPYVLQDDGVYYQESDGLWQIYGSYPSTSQNANVLAADANGVAAIPYLGAQAPYLQPVYYNNAPGGTFESIGGGILINSSGVGSNMLAMNNNNLFAFIAGNIYLSTNNNGVWSSWNQVGSNNPVLSGVFVNNNTVYSISGLGDETLVYVYSLN